MLAAAVNFLLGIYIIYRDPSGRMNRLFAMVAFSLVIWSLGDLLTHVPHGSPELLSGIMSSAGSYFTVAFMLHFFLMFTKNSFISGKLRIAMLYLPAVGFLSLDMALAALPLAWDSFFPSATYILAYTIAGLVLCYRHYINLAPGRERTQSKLLIFAVMFPLVGGTATEVLPRVLQLQSFPLTSSLTALTSVIIAYAIIKHGLMTVPGMRFGLVLKILMIFVILSTVPLLVTAYFSMSFIGEMSGTISGSASGIRDEISLEVGSALKEMGESMIRNKAESVAWNLNHQLEHHMPGLLMEELRERGDLKDAAVQKVGRTGYTAVHDTEGINHFHVNENLVGTDLHDLAGKLPEFWAILESSLEGEAWGHYAWEDEDGSIRDKYMHCTHTERGGLVVCATTYIDEFSEPLKDIDRKMNASVTATVSRLEMSNSLFTGMIWIISGSMSIVILIFGLMISRAVTNPLVSLAKVAGKIGKGERINRLDDKHNDEIGQLAKAFNMMDRNLRKSKRKLEEYNRSLETEVKRRTKELERKVGELKKTKMATLNMMEDLNETNEELERKKREIGKANMELKRFNRELKKMDMLKSEFMNIGAHELKTPLIPIVGYLDMMSKEKNLTSEQRNEIAICLRNAKRLQALVQDILDISKLESRAMKFDMQEMDLRKILMNTFTDMKSAAKDKGLQLKVSLPQKPLKVMGDPYRLTQVTENLVNNAIKFTDSGHIAIEASRGNGNVLVEVKDTGVGVSRKDLSKLFTKFFQADTSAKRKYGGSGLGLAICKSIVEEHKGRIWAKSKPGKGSTFAFSLPGKGGV